MHKCYRCEYETCFTPLTEFCYSNNYCYTSVTLDSDQKVHLKRGCEDSGFFCNAFIKKNNHSSSVKFDCCRSNFCNDGPFPILEKAFQTPKNDASSFSHVAIMIASTVLIAFLVFVIYRYRNKLFLKFKHNAQQQSDNPKEREKLNQNVELGKIGSIQDCKVNIEDSSGSGAGIDRRLIQVTLAKQIDLKECIGRGRYGEVWRGIFNSEDVAVKKFNSHDEASWKREIEIYGTVMLNHDNILAFIGSDIISLRATTQMWLVTAYHKLGSLFDHLNTHTLSMEDMFSVMISIASGINHLHTEVFGTRGKPAIAHRDIKSKNILMMSHNSCCIADFGLAVTHEETSGLSIPFNYRVGTKRYMPPEVLDGTLCEADFNSYKKADIYSLGLVFWEIIRRVQTPTISAFEYMVPYQDMVQSDPSFEEMRHVVCVKELRPFIPQEYHDNEILLDVIHIISESWSTTPAIRSATLLIKKKLLKLSSLLQANEAE